MNLTHWRKLFIIEASGLRTTLAVMVPLVAGQLAGSPALGVMIGAGGLQLSFTDQEGSTAGTLLWGIAGCMAALSLGGLVASAGPITAVVLMLLLAFVMGMLAIFGNVAGNLGYIVLLTYASAQSLPIPLHRDVEHLLWFGLGGFWSVGLTLMLWRLRRALGDRNAGEESRTGMVISANDGGTALPPGTASRRWRDAIAGNLGWRSSDFQHAIRMAVAASAAVAIGRFFHPAHSFWLIVTVLVVIKPEYSLTRKRTLERVLGSVAGGLGAMVLVSYVHDQVALDILLAVFGVLAFSQLPRNYGLYVVFLTPFVVLLAGIAAPSDTGAATARIYQTLLGGVLGFMVAFLLRSPSDWQSRAARRSIDAE